MSVTLDGGDALAQPFGKDVDKFKAPRATTGPGRAQ
jgi:hypothetical protein